MNTKSLLKILFMFVIPASTYNFCLYMELPDNFAMYGAITLWAIYCWISSTLNTTMVAIALPVLYIVLDVADTKTVFSPWAGPVPWLCLGGLLIGQMLLKCGLATRISYKCMLLSGDTFIHIMLGLVFAGILIAPLIPTVLGKSAVFFILGAGICKVLELPPDSNKSAAIFMTCLFAVTGPSYGFLTSCAQVPAAIQLMQGASSIEVTWFEYAFHNIVPSLIYTALSICAILIVLRPGNISGIRLAIQDKYNELGPLSSEEKKALVILIVTLILLFSESIHKVHAAWCMILMATITFLPGVNLLENNDIEKISFSLLYFLAGAMSIGAAAAQIGVAEQIALFVAQFLEPGQAVMHIAASFFLGITSVLFLSPTTSVGALSVPLTKIALQIGTDPRVLVYAFFYGIDMYFMPYQYALLLLLLSFKGIRSKHMCMVLFTKAILSILVLLPAMIFYWHFIGLW